MLSSMIRTIVLYVLILVSLRFMGKRQIGQLQTSELVVTLLLSELAVLPIQNLDETLLEGIAPMLILVVFELLIAFLMLKSSKFRRIICGKPEVIIKNGKVDQKAMRKMRMTTEDLSEQLRQQNAFSLSSVKYAIIETNGNMSVIKAASDDSLTPKQAGVKAEDSGVEAVVVADGEISKNSINLIGQTEEWVLSKVKNENINIKDVFIMTADSKGKYRVIPQELRKMHEV